MIRTRSRTRGGHTQIWRAGRQPGSCCSRSKMI
jgi:hypothetical protein